MCPPRHGAREPLAEEITQESGRCDLVSSTPLFLVCLVTRNTHQIRVPFAPAASPSFSVDTGIQFKYNLPNPEVGLL